MSEVQSQGPVDTAPPQDTVFESVDTSLQAGPEAPHGEHEVVKREKPVDQTHVDEAAASAQEIDNSKTNGTEPTQSGGVPVIEDAIDSPADEDKKQKPTAITDSGEPKATMSVETTDSKSAGPPMPLVKKILNSGTFGAGAVKNAPASKAVSNVAASAANKASSAMSALRKSVSAPASSPTKPTSVAKTPSTGTSATGPARRTSIVPSKPSAPPLSKSSLSSSTSKPPLSSTSKPPSSSTSKPTASTTSKLTTATRPAVSPTGSTTSVKSSATATRPRASVSEGVKKAPVAGRHSISGATKPPAVTSIKAPVNKTTVTKPTRTTGSISSIKEVREDGKAVEELQSKLKETRESLSSKSEIVAELEGQIRTLKSSLEAALSDVQAKQELVEHLEQVLSASEAELVEAKSSLQKFEDEDSSGALLVAQQQLNASKAAVTGQTELIQNLQTQINKLEMEAITTKENLDTLRASHTLASSEAAAAAQVDRDALVQAKANLEAVVAEAEALKATHNMALKDATTKLNEYQSKAAGVETLEKELAILKAEKEEAANKLSELEIEILELKESQDKAEDEHGQSLARVKALEDELVKAVAATQQAIDNAIAKDSEHLQHAADVKKAHDEKLKVISDEQAKLEAHIEALKAELAASQAAYKQAKVDVQTVAEDHSRQLSEAERLHLDKQDELMGKIQKISAELEGQEARYNAKIDDVRAEHSKLLEDAFERAKNEAGEVHGHDLQSLRAESQATIEQLQTVHQSSIADMKNEHANLLDSQVKALEKKITNQALELKATQDDLAKAKAAVEASHVEVENLTTQLEDAKAAAAVKAPPDPALVEEIELLTRELAHAKDDVAAIQEALNLTKQTLSEASSNQTRELEEAAKGRAEEVTRIKAAHEVEVAALVGQKSELATSLSDLEGELATLKASAATEPPASPKANGTNGIAQPTSPGVTKEELQRMHEAHNAKVHDLQAEHEKALKALKESLDASLSKSAELQQEVTRKTMELNYLEQEQEESTDQITRLKEDMGSLSEQLKAKEASITA